MNYATNYEQFRLIQKEFKSSDGSIKYIDKGSGKVILLLHGVPTSGWLYRKIIDPLVAKGYRVIAPDMLGFGASDNPKGYEIYNEINHAKRLLELMNDLKIENWTHVFHDASGLWTWELLKMQSNRINKLIILNTIIYSEGFKPPMKFGKNIFTKFIMKLYSKKMFNGKLIKGLFDTGLQENNLSKTDLQGYKQSLLEGKTNAMYYFFSKTCHKIPDNKTLLQSLRIPVKIIWGKHDPFLKWEPQKESVVNDLKIKTEDIHILDESHFIQETNHQKIIDIISEV